MRDGAAERAVLGAFDIDMNPLVIAGDVGKAVDAILIDQQPLGRAECGAFCADEGDVGVA